MRLGLPYKGSKNSIAREIIDCLPAADVFVDLFAGGCAVTHAAMLSRKYKRYICNDINDYPSFFIECMQGKHNIRNHTEWISREDFFRLKDTDNYVKYVWSFGNNGKDYLYSKDKEEFKHCIHRLLMNGETEPIYTTWGVQ